MWAGWPLLWILLGAPSIQWTRDYCYGAEGCALAGLPGGIGAPAPGAVSLLVDWSHGAEGELRVYIVNATGAPVGPFGELEYQVRAEDGTWGRAIPREEGSFCRVISAYELVEIPPGQFQARLARIPPVGARRAVRFAGPDGLVSLPGPGVVP